MQEGRNVNLSSGKIWPYAISISIILIFGACVATIVVATKLPVEKSDLYMADYHDADKNANALIKSRIAFDKKYKIDYIAGGLSIDNSSVKYRVTDVNSNLVDNANIVIVVTRPNSRKFDLELNSPIVKDGIYSFSGINLPKEGRWDIMAKVSVDDLIRYYNVKADTRDSNFTEY